MYETLTRATMKLSLTSPYDKFPMGAIIARKNKIVSMGTNRWRTHPIQAKYQRYGHLRPNLHAEIHAITLANAGDLAGADVYIGRSLADGSPGTSRPCCGCLRALHDYGLCNMIFYENGQWTKEKVPTTYLCAA